MKRKPLPPRRERLGFLTNIPAIQLLEKLIGMQMRPKQPAFEEYHPPKETASNQAVT